MIHVLKPQNNLEVVLVLLVLLIVVVVVFALRKGETSGKNYRLSGSMVHSSVFTVCSLSAAQVLLTLNSLKSTYTLIEMRIP